MSKDLAFYKGKRVFITGHTGFKGSWLTKILVDAGAIVTGYSLKPPTTTNLWELLNLEENMVSIIGDIRDYKKLSEAFEKAEPEIVFHLAAQPIVLTGYQDPKGTYETNVMGTVNILECVRHSDTVKSILNVTTDKVYQNNEWEYGYRECDPLDGYDPYSNSKSCSELVTHCYKSSFFDTEEHYVAASTARAGNVIGGGDFASNRIIPDCVRAAKEGSSIVIRNPYSTRPYQHVLEPLFAYLMIAEKQYNDQKYAGFYNVGPDDIDCVTTGDLADLFCKEWGQGLVWHDQGDPNAPHEARFLKLDCSKLKQTFSWTPTWNISETVRQTVKWYQIWLQGGDISLEMEREIKEFIK